MTDFEDEAIAEALRSELGAGVSFHAYDRENSSPMNFVLNEVERQIGSRFRVYWADGGPSEIFCLSGFSRDPVVFSTGYLALAVFVRNLFADFLGDREMLIDVAMRTSLKVIAEMGLRHGDPDLAVLALVKSLVGKGIWSYEDVEIMELESWPIQENYMATWFYGLAHELGHLQQQPAQTFPDGHPFSDAGILTAITLSIEEFTSYPPEVRNEVLDRATRMRAGSVIGIDQVRSEGLADIFAASILFKTTVDIMRKVDQKIFEVDQFVAEMVIFFNVLSVIDRCRRVAVIASASKPNREAAIENVAYPISIMTRCRIQRLYLDHAVARYLSGGAPPSLEQEKAAEEMNNRINDHFSAAIDSVDTGMGKALEFALFAERRENDWDLLESLRRELCDTSFGVLASMEIQKFCKLAEALGKNGKLLVALRRILDDPQSELVPDFSNDVAYFVLWVKGPNGTNRPFGLDTKHGHLVFVFHCQDGLFESFFQSSATTLKSGFSLQKTLVPAPRVGQIGEVLASRMPAGQRFQIIFEGTDKFQQYMRELGNDTIWE